MKIEQLIYTSDHSIARFKINPDLIFAFGQRDLLEDQALTLELAKNHPDAIFSGCSTAGEIMGETVTDGKVIVTAIEFESITIQSAKISLQDIGFNSYEAGKKLASQLSKEGLKHVFVVSDGLKVNGTDLVKGIADELPENVTLTGGLAGDGASFSKTVIVEPDGHVTTEHVAAIGFYGDALQIGFGSRGGWDSFGLDRLVTKSKDNVLFEIDGQPALDLYKSFLGEKARELPSSGLLFPLSMRDSEDRTPVVRTILGINEEEKSLTFAGVIPEGSFVKLMKANTDRLINGAAEAAMVAKNGNEASPEFAILVSCVGRKLVLKQIIEEEVECVSEVLGKPVITGFYSYGEIAPFDQNALCELHNQTMTITTFREL
jgi:hypothetical protein